MSFRLNDAGWKVLSLTVMQILSCVLGLKPPSTSSCIWIFRLQLKAVRAWTRNSERPPAVEKRQNCRQSLFHSKNPNVSSSSLCTQQWNVIVVWFLPENNLEKQNRASKNTITLPTSRGWQHLLEIIIHFIIIIAILLPRLLHKSFLTFTNCFLQQQ